MHFIFTQYTFDNILFCFCSFFSMKHSDKTILFFDSMDDYAYHIFHL